MYPFDVSPLPLTNMRSDDPEPEYGFAVRLLFDDDGMILASPRKPTEVWNWRMVWFSWDITYEELLHNCQQLTNEAVYLSGRIVLEADVLDHLVFHLDSADPFVDAMPEPCSGDEDLEFLKQKLEGPPVLITLLAMIDWEKSTWVLDSTLGGGSLDDEETDAARSAVGSESGEEGDDECSELNWE